MCNWQYRKGTIICCFRSDSGADIEEKDSSGWTHLHLASFYGHVDIVKLFIYLGADIEAKTNNGWTSLHLASRYGHIDIVKLLINPDRGGADVKAKTNDGSTPLHYASLRGHIDTVKLLIAFALIQVQI